MAKNIMFIAIILWLSIASKSNQYLSGRVKKNIVDIYYGTGSNIGVIGPRCIPLVSKNIESNPYHPSLLSIPGKQIRRGNGMAINIPANPMKCNHDATKSCTISVSNSFTTSVSNSFSISLGASKSFSKSISDAKTKGKSNTFTDSMSKTIEKSLSKAHTTTDEASFSNTVSESLSNTHEKSSGFSSTRSQEDSDTNTLSQDTTTTDSSNSETSLSNTLSSENSNSRSRGGANSGTQGGGREKTNSNTLGAELGFKGGPVSGSFSASKTNSETNSENWSNTEESNWNNQNTATSGSANTQGSTRGSSNSVAKGIGRSNARTKTFGSSSTKDNRVSDSVSRSKENARTSTRTRSNSDTDTQTNSQSYTVDESFSSTNENSMTWTTSASDETSKTQSNENSTTFSFSTTLTTEQSFDVPPGTCKVPVCIPFVKSIPIPFECVNENTVDHYTVEYMFDLETSADGKLKCAYTLIDCDDDQSLFMNLNNEAKNADKYNSLDYGRIEVAPFSLKSNSKVFELILKETGELVLMRHEIVIWSNDMGLFHNDHDDKEEESESESESGSESESKLKKNDKKNKKNYEIRIRLNEKGHLVEEAKGLFTEFSTEFRKNEWVTIWSSAPINHNVTIGIPSIPNNYNSYKLVLEDSGRLNFYDAVESIIWCATNIENVKCKHSKGYKFPEVYLVPTNIITPEDTDKHNSIDPKIRSKNYSFINSLDADCNSFILSNEGIKSKNGRFKAILEESGNLIIKDNYRTMWESASGFLHFSEAPFKLVIIPTGNIAILDSNNLMVWTSVLRVENTTRPYKLTILDSGRLVLTDKNKVEIWESTPLRNMSTGNTILEPFNYRFVKCHGKAPERTQTTEILKSNQRETLSLDERLVSKNGKHVLQIKDEQLLFNSEPLYTSKSLKKLSFLKIRDDGLLVLCDENNTIVWKSKHKFLPGVYKMILTDDGKLNILNKTDHVVYSMCNTTNLYKGLRLTNHYKQYNNSKINDHEDCWSHCKKEMRCKATSFDKSSKSCYLFDRNYSISRNFSFTTYSLTPLTHIPDCESAFEYTIKFNDICLDIAMSRSLGLYDLVDSNAGLDCDDLEIDSKLCVPYASKTEFVYSGVKLVNHISNPQASSAEQCWSYCKREIKCRAISFNYTDNNCFLFDKNYQIQEDAFFVTYTIDEINLFEF